MTETLENIIQLVVTGICAGAAIYRAMSYKVRVWVNLALFYILFFLGDLYWLLYLVFYGKTPELGYISDITWYAAIVFIILLLQQINDEKPVLRTFWPWLGPVFSAGMCVFYLQWGDYLGNILICVIMGILLWIDIYYLFCGRRKKIDDGRKRFLYIMVLVIVFLEYLMWTLSCYWMGDTLANPYFWVDFMLTASLPLLLAAVRKAVDR